YVFGRSAHPRDLHSFPTRRSSDLLRKSAVESSFEALVLLAELGAPPSKREVLESIEIRMALEQLAVRLACERRGPEDLRRLTDTVEATDRVLATSGNICALDQSFHTALAEAS